MFINARVTRTFVVRHVCRNCGDVRNAEVIAKGAGNGRSDDEAVAAAVADARTVAEQTIDLVRCPGCQSPSHMIAPLKRQALKHAVLLTIFGALGTTGVIWTATAFQGDAMSVRGAAIACASLAVAILVAGAWSVSRPFRGISSRVKWLPQ